MFEFLADAIVYRLLGLTAKSSMGAALHFFILDTSKIRDYHLCDGIISLPSSVREYLRGRSQIWARLAAITLGAVTTFCSCSSVPLFIGFVKAGIPLGVTFAFLIASPMAVVLLAGILGWQLTLLYVAAGLTVAYVVGAVMERCHPERWVEAYVWKIQMGSVGGG